MDSATAYFSGFADQFIRNYFDDPDARERYGLWALLIDKYARGVKQAYDLGCGPGFLSFHTAKMGIAVTGIDGSARMIDFCERQKSSYPHLETSFIKAEIPFTKDLLVGELIICSSLLEYVPDLSGTIRWIHGLLAPRGTLILSLPNAASVYRRYEKIKYRLTGQPDYYQYVRNVLNVDQTKMLLKSCGFQYMEHHYYGRSPRLAKLASIFLRPAHSDNLFVAVFSKIP